MSCLPFSDQVEMSHAPVYRQEEYQYSQKYISHNSKHFYQAHQQTTNLVNSSKD